MTGGTGFVGQAVLDEACRRGLQLRALARREQAPREGVEWVRGDLADRAALARLVEGAEAVLHVAGVVNAPDPMGFHLGNVAGTEALVEAAEAAGVRALRVRLLARRARAGAVGLRRVQAPCRGSGRRPAGSTGRSSARRRSTARATARSSRCSAPRAGAWCRCRRAGRASIDPCRRPGAAAARAGRRAATRSPHRIFEPDDGRAGGWSHRELAAAIGEAVGRRVWAPAVPQPVLSARRAGSTACCAARGAKLTPDRVGYMAHPDWVSRPDKAPPRSCGAPRSRPAKG